MVEIEIGVLQGQCLSRRIVNRETLEAVIAAWEQKRNDGKKRIKWMFTVNKAWEKLVKAYTKFDDCNPQSKESNSLL